MERSFKELLGVFKTVRIVEELIEIWPNEVCDNFIIEELPFSCSYD